MAFGAITSVPTNKMNHIFNDFKIWLHPQPSSCDRKTTHLDIAQNINDVVTSWWRSSPWNGWERLFGPHWRIWALKKLPMVDLLTGEDHLLITWANQFNRWYINLPLNHAALSYRSQRLNMASIRYRHSIRTSEDDAELAKWSMELSKSLVFDDCSC